MRGVITWNNPQPKVEKKKIGPETLRERNQGCSKDMIQIEEEEKVKRTAKTREQKKETGRNDQVDQ